MKFLRSLFIVQLLFVIWAHADTYFVATIGNDTNHGRDDTAAGAWRTIGHAAALVEAGDVIRVQAGEYAEQVSLTAVAGTRQAPISFVADGEVTLCGWVLRDCHHIRLVGFTIDSDLGSCVQAKGGVTFLGAENTSIELWHNTIRDALYNGVRTHANTTVRSSLFVGNKIENMGVGNGSGTGIHVIGHHNLIGYNIFDNMHPDGIVVVGTHNRIINNYMFNASEASGGHSDFFQTGSNAQGFAQNLIEANFLAGSGTEGDEHFIQISNSQTDRFGEGSMRENLFRHNVIHNTGSGHGINQAFDGDITHSYFIHNTEVETSRTNPRTRYGFTFISTGVRDNQMRNNIFYEAWGVDATTKLEVFYSQNDIGADYNLAFDPDGPVTFAASWHEQLHAQHNQDPHFQSVGDDDFTLSEGSHAIGNAGPLTEVNESFTTAGTQFNVNDALYFRGDDPTIHQYAGMLVVGDKITIGAQSRRIVNIEGTTITVSEALSWDAGAPVYYGGSTSPDIGAYPAHHVRLESATLAKADNRYQVFPAGDTRWVVFFVDGLPHVVDVDPPYAATVPVGIML